MGRLFFICLLLVFSLPLYAEDKFTASIEIGTANSSLNNSNVINRYNQLSNTSNIDNSSSALLLSLGYRLDDYLSIGSDFLTSGSIVASESGSTYKLFSTDTISVYAQLRKKLSESTTIYAKLGMHLWSLSENLTAPGGLDDGVDLTYGVGTYIDVYGGSNRQLAIQWNRFEYNGVYVNNSDTLSLGLLFIF